MKGYRKLRVGEVIKKGDVYEGCTGKEPYSISIGMKVKADWISASYRPLPKKARKVKKITPLHTSIDRILSECWTSQQASRRISSFIRRNYRRRT